MNWLDGITNFDGHGFGWTPGVGDGQGGLACCGSWGCKESDTTERLNCIPVAQRVNRLSAMQETQLRFLGWEDPLEKEMATHSSTLAWKIPWMEKPDRLQSMGSQRIRHD